MSDIKDKYKELNPRLQQMLAAYDNLPERDPEAARRTQARFMAELDSIFVKTLPSKPTAGSWLHSTFDAKHQKLGHLFAKRSRVFVGLTLLAFLAYFFGGAGMTAYAASSALPGDPLYPLKTTMEVVRADLTIDSAKQARLYMNFAGRRLIEIQSLIRKGRHNNIPRAATELEMDVQRSLSAIEILSQTDPDLAADLTTEFSPVLRSYSAILTHLLNLIPGSVRPALQHAIDTCNIAAGNHDDDSNNPVATPTPTATPVVVSPTPVLDVLTPATIPGRGGNDNNNDGGNNGNGGNNSGGSQDDDDDDDDDGGGDG
jgi:hypothetical protein